MPSVPMLQPDYRAKLVKLLGMLGSDHDGERAAAALLADQHRRKCGLTWGEILIPAPAPEALKPERPRKARKPRKAKATKPAPPEPSWRDMAAVVAESGLATQWERNFASGLLEKWNGPLTEKQAKCLEKLFAKCKCSSERAA